MAVKFKNILRGERSYILGLLLVSFVVLSVALVSSLKFSPDSDGYLKASIYRSPVYPMFLEIIELIFGRFKDFAVIFIQTILGLSSSFYLLNTLKNNTQLKNVWLIILFGIMVFPYVSEQPIGNKVLSEGLSYPLYLAAIALLFKSFISKKSKHLVSTLSVLFFLLLTRTQFLFLIPVAIAISLWLFLVDRSSKKPLYIGFIFLILPFLTNLVDKTYHSIKHDHFASTPWTGIHLLTPAIFVAQETDIDLYDNSQERLFFKEMYSILKSKGLNVNHKHDPHENDIDIYIREYGEIANGTLFYKGLHTLSDGEITDDNFILVDQLTKSMTPRLIWKNKADWLKVYIMNYIHGFGSLSLLLVFILLLLFGWVDFFKKPSIFNKAILFFTICTLANVGIVSIGMHTIQRFTFYNDWVIFLLLFMIINHLNTTATNAH